MISSQKEFLSRFGWDGFFERETPTTLSSDSLFIGRVINEEKNLYRIQYGEEKTIWSAVSGKMNFEAMGRIDYPAVGDWVLAELSPGSDKAVIRFIFKRKTILQRKKNGEVSEIQILAANVDYVFITTSINSDLNFGRLERYLTFARESGAEPVILLTKTDLGENVEETMDKCSERFPGTKIHALSRDNFESSEFLKKYLEAGKTSVLVGSSGVGKSTLANFLIGEDLISTREIRLDDDKGMHTTTSRALYECLYGGLIIDTPGMRELQFSDHEAGLNAQFDDVENLISRCHYSNCRHETEKNCAILMALQSGELDPSRWKSYGKIAKEVRHSMRKQHSWILAQDRKEWKKLSVSCRQKYKGWR